jgi:AraC-like DNA-binding protein
MSSSPVYTVTNPRNGHLAFKVYPFRDNSPFDHLQRLNYYTIILLAQGRGKLTADFAEWDVSGNSLLFFAPYQPFMLRSSEDLRGIVLHFHSDFFCIHQHQKEVACNGVLFNNVYQAPVLPVSPAEMDGFREWVEQMKPEIQQTALAQHELLVSYLKIFLIRATRLKHAQQQSELQEITNRRKYEVAQELKETIEKHYRVMHSAGDYADLLHVSSKVLARIAKAQFNKTITALVSERIVIEAKRELYMTSKTVKEIAYLLGFEDEFYFSRFFKNNADVSPQVFRETVGFARAEPLRGSAPDHLEVPGAN